jgi:hypothetical protein
LNSERKSAKLSLRELEALARTLLSVLFAFLNTRIARNQSCLLQCRPQVGVVFHQGAGDAVANRAGLARWPTARDINQHIKLAGRLRQVKRLANDHTVCFVGKVRLKRLMVNLKTAIAGP